MSDVVGHLAQAFHQGADAVEHAIERGGQALEIIATARLGHAAREVAVDDGFGGAGDGGDPSAHAAAKAVAAEQADHYHPHDRQQESLGQQRVNRLDALVVAADQQPITVRQTGGIDANPLPFTVRLAEAEVRPARNGAALRQPPGDRTPVRGHKAIVQRAGGPIPLLHGLGNARQAFDPELLHQGGGLRQDPRVELSRERRPRRQHGDDAQHQHRGDEGGRVERGEPQAGRPEHL